VFSLAGKKALVVGIANEDSIAFGCAKAFRAQGPISPSPFLA
jgi:enoyl-[acyl-carrier protein] reductase I